MTKKTVQAVCRVCGNDFWGQAGTYRCPRCKEQDQLYKAHREKLKNSLPFYLKTLRVPDMNLQLSWKARGGHKQEESGRGAF